MKNLEELYNDLEKYSNFEVDEANTEHFLETVDAIVLKNDPSSVPILLQYFDDNSDYDWVFESARCSIEFFDKESFVDAIIKNISNIKTKRWNKSFIFSIFNSPEYLTLFRTHMHLADRETLLKLFDLMEKESPHHQDLISELRSELNT
jgi:hypothetical protein